MLTIGLTGGIASGKSLVAHYFSRYGIGCVDADQVARDVVMPGQPLLAKIAEHFGDAVLESDGSLNRRELRHLIFASPEQRQWLEAHMHPVIRERIFAQLDTLGGPYRLMMVPLLLESEHYAAHVDRILVVDVDEETQLARVTARDGGSKHQAEAIVAAQMPRSERLARADDIIDNSADQQHLLQQVTDLHHAYCALAHEEQR
ncbi:dephospho-CoA kinase [Carnimonas bestiolae]|uniref:dephospho-CoA kinase n=1 Tax=Carnimonas bestiolae TaxID=3402172 RepID=UPI003EDC65B2